MNSPKAMTAVGTIGTTNMFVKKTGIDMACVCVRAQGKGQISHNDANV